MSILLRTRHHAEAQAQAKVMATIAREVGTHDPTVLEKPTQSKLPGDEKALRGIPVVGARGVGGAILGTRPGYGIG